MNFRIEQVFLVDETGHVVPSVENRVYHVEEGVSVDQVLASFVTRDQGAQIVGNVLRLPGLQAIATVKREAVVYTLHVLPATDRMPTQR